MKEIIFALYLKKIMKQTTVILFIVALTVAIGTAVYFYQESKNKDDLYQELDQRLDEEERKSALGPQTVWVQPVVYNRGGGYRRGNRIWRH